MRNIWALVALTMVVGCGGGDGKDGRDGAQGAMGAAGPPGANGEDGDDGEPGADGMNGEDGAPGTNGTNGTNGENGADGSAILQGSGAPAAGLGVDGDIYIDTVSRDVYQKANGTWSVVTNLSGGPAGPKGDKGDPGDPGSDGSDGASVLTGSGVPAAGLGNVGDVYIDSATGELYSKGAGGWTLSGSLKGPEGDAGADGEDGVDVEDTLQGLRWFSFALSAGFVDTPSLITSSTYTDTSSSATFTFTGANQHGRLAFNMTGSYLPGGANLVSFDGLNLEAAVTGGDVTALRLYLVDGDNKGCQWSTTTAAGPVYTFDLADPETCYNTSAASSGFTMASVTGMQIGIVSSGAGARTLTINAIELVSN